MVQKPFWSEEVDGLEDLLDEVGIYDHRKVDGDDK